MVEVRKLVKEFGRKKALRGVDLTLYQGDFVVLFGPNGAGKTTLLKIISTVMFPTSGEVLINSRPVRDNETEARKLIGFVTHHPLLYEDLTVRENLSFYGRMYGIKDIEKKMRSLLEKVGLLHRQEDLVGTLSRGLLQRLAIVRALLHDPLLLLFDEPYTGLDPSATLLLDKILKSLKEEGRTVLMTSHDLERGYQQSERIILLSRGKIFFEARREEISLQGLKQKYFSGIDDFGEFSTDNGPFN